MDIIEEKKLFIIKFQTSIKYFFSPNFTVNIDDVTRIIITMLIKMNKLC